MIIKHLTIFNALFSQIENTIILRFIFFVSMIFSNRRFYILFLFRKFKAKVNKALLQKVILYWHLKTLEPLAAI